MNTINHNSPSFQAKFKKLPVKIEAVQMQEAFKVPNPWAKGEMLEGKAGDSLVTNLLNNERYPIQPEVLKQKYEHISGNLYQTRMDKEVLIEADLPKALEILSREGAEKTYANGIPAMEAIDGAGMPYAIPGDYFMKAYAPIDDAGKKIIENLKKLMP